jgi:putative endopeptidase
MLLLFVTLLLTTPALTPADTLPSHLPKPAYGPFGVDLTGMNPLVKPGNDFFRYANGAWLRRTPIPASRASQTTFALLGDRARQQTRRLLDSAAAVPGSQAGDFYASYLDSAAANRRGVAPVRPWLRALAQCSTKQVLVAAMAQAQRRGVTGLFDNYISVTQPAPSAPLHPIFVLEQDGLGLPGRSDYLGTPATAAQLAYQHYLTTLLQLAGEPQAAQRAQAVLRFETQVARGHWTPAQAREVSATTNVYSQAKLQASEPSFAWATYLHALGVPASQPLLVREPSAFRAETRAWQSTPLPVLRDWLQLRVLDQFAPYLSEPFVAAHFAFHQTALEGVTQRVPRGETGTDLVARYLPDGAGRLYADKYFPASSKRAVEQLVTSIKAAFEQRLLAEEWLSDATKARAVTKLRNLKVLVGYPDTWQDYTPLAIGRQDLVGNVARTAAFRYDTELAKLGRPVDRAYFPYAASTMMAWTMPDLTEIAFTAAFLQPPLYDPQADAAVNYGAIGTVIGHEISHNFDDQGRQRDELGAVRAWWQPGEVATFTQQAERLARQFDAYEPVAGAHVNGQLTLGENLADLTGLEISYAAYGAAQLPARTLDGFTPAQRFFLGYAQSCRATMREPALRGKLQHDPHAPFETRLLEVRNLSSWYEAFGISPTDKLFLPPAERVRVW